MSEHDFAGMVSREGVRVLADSHVDHGLSREQLFACLCGIALPDPGAVKVQTVSLPDHLPDVACGLHGPVMGDAPIWDPEITYRRRPGRSGKSRTVDRAPRPTRMVTVVVGPHEGHPTVLYTAYPGPAAPREPWDSSMGDEELDESRAFWATHALGEAS